MVGILSEDTAQIVLHRQAPPACVPWLDHTGARMTEGRRSNRGRRLWCLLPITECLCLEQEQLFCIARIISPLLIKSSDVTRDASNSSSAALALASSTSAAH